MAVFDKPSLDKASLTAILMAGLMLTAGLATAAGSAQFVTDPVSFGGRVIAGGAPRADVFVHLEGLNLEILGTVLTDGDGSFVFRGVTFNTPFVFIVIEEPGFKPYRDRLDVSYLQGGVLAIYLEPEIPPDARPTDDSADGSLLVDVRQLQLEIPDEAREAYDRGVAEAENGRPAEAIEEFERALELAPDFYEARINLGYQYAETGRFADAEGAYLRARESNPSGALAPLNLGALYYQEAERVGVAGDAASADARLEQAKEALERALTLNPASAEARFYLGAVMYRLGNLLQAEQLLLSSIDLDPEGGQARLTLVNVYTRAGLLDAALEQIAAFIDENPDSPQRASIEQVRSQIEAVLEP